MKKILFLAYEIEDHLISQISLKIKNELDCSESSIFFCDTWRWTDSQHLHTTDELNALFDSSYSLSEEYALANKIISFQIDFEYLRGMERLLGMPLELIMTSDPLVYGATHDRNYYTNISQKFRMFWLEKVLKKIEKCLNEFEPDLVFTVGNNYLVKNLFYEICKVKKIRMITLGPARLDNLYILSESFLLNTDATFKAYQVQNKGGCDLYKLSLERITKELDSPYDSHKKYIRKYGFGLLKDHVKQYPALFGQFRRKIKLKNNKLQPNFLDNKYWRSIYYEIETTVRAIFLQCYRYDPISDDQDYAYFPLHVTPESAVLTMGRGLDEYLSIKNISARLPIGTNLVVKENPKMIGLRPLSFYKKLRKIPNVLLVSPNESQQKVIKNAVAVFTVAGTSALEGLFFNKPVYCIGNTEYANVDGISKLDSSSDPIIIPLELVENGIVNYCNFIADNSIKIDLNFLLYAPYQIPDYDRDLYNSDLIKIVNLLAIRMRND